MIPCVPPLPLEPQVDKEMMINTMLERIEVNARQNGLSIVPKELDREIILRFLKSQKYDIEFTLNKWQRWVQWRKRLEFDIDNIPEGDIHFELDSKLAYWNGNDRSGRPCCVVIGRHHNPFARSGGYASFQKFLIYIVLKGVDIAKERGIDKVCVVYDRRDLELQHMDRHLFLVCRKLIGELSEFYGDILGTLFVVHAHWTHWPLFQYVAKPILGLYFRYDPIILVNDWPDLLQYFDEDGLPPDPLLLRDCATSGENGAELPADPVSPEPAGTMQR